MSLSSLKSRLLSPSLSPKLWREQIRATNALGQLESGHWDQFPLSQVQTLTDALIKTCSKKGYLGLGGGVEPCSDDCHTAISTWADLIPEELVQELTPILDLEGPDSQGGRRVRRLSTPGVFGPGLLNPFPRDDAILDHILKVFDRCILKGNEAIRLFITLCVEPKTLNWQVIERLEAALTLDSPSDMVVLDAYVRSFRDEENLHTMRCFTEVLQVLQPSAALQSVFGAGFNLQLRSRRVFYHAQKQLHDRFLQGELNEAYAHQLSDLGHELLSAEWLHRTWPRTYIEGLRMVPRKPTISSLLRSMDKSPRDVRVLLQQFLVLTLYCRRTEGLGQVQLEAAADISLALADPAWQVSLEDESDREKLRDMMLVAMIRGFDPTEATSCVRRADGEHREIIRSMREILGGHNEDVVCIALAKFLAVDYGTRRPAEAWLRLLMHMMRRGSPGLHTRCAERLPLGPWEAWTRHLEQLFKGRHFDPEGGMRFTVEGFERIRTEKRGVSRMASTSTYSTASTGRYYETFM